MIVAMGDNKACYKPWRSTHLSLRLYLRSQDSTILELETSDWRASINSNEIEQKVKIRHIGL